MTKERVLIVEDEPEIAELIRINVERAGFETAWAVSGRRALDEIGRERPDVVLLDLMLPDGDGLEVCRRLRSDPPTKDLPIVIVSAKGEEPDIVAGIELGADDYVTKPFSPRVLIARIRNVLRRAGRLDDGPARRIASPAGTIVIDEERHRVSVDEQVVDLTLTEFGILRYLASRPGFVRTRDQIISAVHGGNTVLSPRTVDVHVTGLRRKLGPLGSLIETVRGVGYRLSDGAAAGVS
ncbi:MAG: response regulator transcription factor [Phycisphaerales bacterium]|nr:response regulator transcription factor [Phycisphaerae bacterium]NNF41892.1 response regulator transcription factor [Phycisphaerales bacterium]NNM27321.1 response regulator transcription factor [Phycisphaerales bacterium]